ncbi:MAG: hypothetical protein ABJC89_19320 [Acidobacteriota bacterium]
MQKWWRLLGLAAAMNVGLGAGVALAQTVVVRKAPAGTTVEVALSAATVGTAPADANGDAIVAFKLPETDGKAELDAYVFVDYCDTMRRVVVVERGRAPLPPSAGCERREIPGLYWVRRVSTLVVDVGGPIPTLLLIKGTYGLNDPVARSWTPSMTGLSVFGGGALSSYRDARQIACGDVTPCGGSDSGIGYTAGATFWFSRFLAAEGGYVKPHRATANGSSTTFTFNSELDPRLITIVGKVGGPIGPVRLYGLGGANYHQAMLTTTETIDSVTQTIEIKTKGWGLLFGGGGEVWVSRFVALYGELNFASLKGAPTRGGEVRLDDRLRLITFGARVRIGR